MFYRKKDLLGKAATIERFANPPLGKELKAQTEIAEDQYKFFKDQMNVNNKKDDAKPKNDIKREDNKIVDDVGYFYIGKEFNKFIDRIFKIGLIESDLHLMNLSSQNPALINIVDKYLVERKKYLDHIIFNKFNKNLGNTDNKTNMIINKYKLKTKTEYADKKRVASILKLNYKV